MYFEKQFILETFQRNFKLIVNILQLKVNG